MHIDSMPIRRLLLAASLLLLGSSRTRADDEPGAGRVEVLKTPDGGIQPQAVADRRGTLHLIYFKGEPSHGDLYYVKRNPGQSEFTRPIRVNSVAGSAVATGTIRGGQLALGSAGKVHVAWNGSRPDMKTPAPMLYTRLKAGEDGFEPQRSLMKVSTDLDGGGTVAADDAGRVYVAWHARGVSEPAGEDRRKLWVARSTDDGATFDAERPALEQRTGACACCGTRALADSNGRLSILFRAATDGVSRDLYLVSSRDGGDHFSGRSLQPWRINACPMSSASMVDGGDGPVAAWETAGQVYFSRVAGSGVPSAPVAPPGRPGDRKHPAVASAPDGSTLLAWAEGTGWKRGGSLAWCLFDPLGHPTDLKGRVEAGIPVWGLPTIVSGPDGRFTIVH